MNGTESQPTPTETSPASISAATSWVARIPTELGNLTSLTELDLSDNKLSGEIPTELGNLTNLTTLILNNNILSGEIPVELGSLTRLTGLDLSDNKLSGAIPTALGSLTNLTGLDLAWNDLTGPIPTEVGSLTGLLGLDLSSNGLSGTIPSQLGSISGLQSLDLTQNTLEGSIPGSLGSLTALEYLHLGGNYLSGPIPAALGGLTSLKILNLAFAELSGEIPAELGNLTSLKTLYLHENRLSGPIPIELGNLTALIELSLAGNRLTGCVPGELGIGLDRDDLNGLLHCDGLLSSLTLSSATSQTLDLFPQFSIDHLGYKTSTGSAATTIAITAEAHTASSTIKYMDDGGTAIPDADTNLDGHQLALADGENFMTVMVVSSVNTTVTSTYRITVHRDATTVSVPGAPQGTAVDAAVQSLTVRWQAPTSTGGGTIPGYVVQWKLANDTDFDATSRQARVSATSHTLRDLDPGVGYSVRVAAVNSAGTGEWSSVVDGAPLSDKDVLTGLYNSTGGTGWTDGTNWLSMMPLGAWHGVETDADGHVTALRLPENNLSGSIPSSLALLPGLRYLSLYGNPKMGGPIPDELGGLSNLASLRLGGNAIEGTIPAELGQLTKLVYLDLQWNELSGSIPPELGQLTRLRFLDLNYSGVEAKTGLSGPIPTELGSLTELRYLGLAGNLLTGSIPDELAALTHLGQLWLGDNKLSGPIPDQLCSLSELGFLGLNTNQLTGPIPACLGSLSDLEQLHLYGNRLEGQIPADLGDLAGLTELTLGDNSLMGGLPGELKKLGNLEVIDFRRAGLSGTIPTGLGDLSELRWLDLKNNMLTGQIPSDLGNLSKLNVLALRNNMLTGEIPAELGSLTELAFIYLSENGFSGCLPPSWRVLKFAELDRIPGGENYRDKHDLDDLGLAFCDVGLRSLEIAPAGLMPEFSGDRTAYEVTVPNDTAHVTVIATAFDSRATVEFHDRQGAPIEDDDETETGLQVALKYVTDTVRVEVTSKDGTRSKTYTLSVKRQPGWSLSASPPSISETDGVSEVTVATSGLSFDGNQTVTLTLGGDAQQGTDYQLGTTSLKLGTGQMSVSTTLTAIHDILSEGDEMVTLTARHGGQQVGTPQTVTIKDNDAPRWALSVSSPVVAEGDFTHVFINTGGVIFEEDRTVTLMLGGEAQHRVDYELSSEVDLGERTRIAVKLTAIDDKVSEGDETVTVTAYHRGKPVGTQQTVTIKDNDEPRWALSVSPSAVAEAGGRSMIEVSTGNVVFEHDQTVTLTPEGDATEGSDYQLEPKSLQLQSGRPPRPSRSTRSMTT